MALAVAFKGYIYICLHMYGILNSCMVGYVNMYVCDNGWTVAIDEEADSEWKLAIF